MTSSSCRGNARRHLRSFRGVDGTLVLWECFIGQCPEWDLVCEALDQLAGLHDYHQQPLVAAKYREEAAWLRSALKKYEMIT